MRHVGIICEYNPFHGGHEYLLKQVREAETVICLMGGYFTQRGEAAILPPTVRAEMALACGADLVLELPFPYACGSARYFATAGVRALKGLGADALAFGSECADMERLRAAAKRTLTANFEEKTANGIEKTGVAAAYFDALGEEALLPNDILAIEYLRAVLQEDRGLEAFAVKRVGASYHDAESEGDFPSATALRRALERGIDILPMLPVKARAAWERGVAVWGTADIRRLGFAMLAKLRTMGAQKRKSPLTGCENEDIGDLGGGLAERLVSAAWEATDYDSLCAAAATKRYTNGRIRRALLYLMAGVTRDDLLIPPAYVRLLGANEKGREFLAETRKTRTIPVVTKPGDIQALGESAARARELERIAHGLYALCLPRPTVPTALATIPPVMI